MMCYIYTGIRVMCFLQVDWVESAPTVRLSAALNLTFFFPPVCLSLEFYFHIQVFLKMSRIFEFKIAIVIHTGIWISSEPEYKSLQAIQERVMLLILV